VPRPQTSLQDFPLKKPAKQPKPQQAKNEERNLEKKSQLAKFKNTSYKQQLQKIGDHI
jgi:hypothetical protein